MASARLGTLLGSCLLLAACGDDGIAPSVCEVEARLQPGEVLVTDAPRDEPGCGLLLPGGSAGDRYRVALLRPDSAAASSSPQVELRVELVDGGAGAALRLPAAPPSPVSTLAGDATPAPDPTDGGFGALRATGRFHERLRRAEGELVARLGTGGVLVSRGARGLRVAAAPAAPRVVFDPNTSCSGPRQERTALLLGENDALAVYQDSVELPGRRLEAEHVQRLLDFFAEHGREVVEAYFGALPDVDGNGRLHVVASRASFDDQEVVAYVWAGNYYDREDCPASDESEVIYLNPARVESMDRGEYIALGVLSHESAHLVSLYHRLRRTLARGSGTFLSHPTWMEEGRAELADEVTSRLAWSRAGGPARTARVGGAELSAAFAGGRCCRPEAYGVALQAARTIWYLGDRPNGLVVAPTAGSPQADVRNGGWHFHRWLADALGGAAQSPGADAALFRQLTDSSSASGREGLEAVVGRPFEALLEDFVAAVLLHQAGVATGHPGFTTYDFVTLTQVPLSGPNLDPTGVYPWPVTTTSDEDPPSVPFAERSWTEPIGPTGFLVYDLTSDGAGRGARLTVHGVAGLEMVVARLR